MINLTTYPRSKMKQQLSRNRAPKALAHLSLSRISISSSSSNSKTRIISFLSTLNQVAVSKLFVVRHKRVMQQPL